MTFTIHRNEVPIEVEIEFDDIPAYRGLRDSMGCPAEPDTGFDVEISSVKCGGIEILLTSKEEEMAVSQYLEEQ